MKKGGRAVRPVPKEEKTKTQTPKKTIGQETEQMREARYLEVLRYLYGLQKFGIKLGLQNIRSLLSSLGNPESSFKCIHVAGTNGKGSTSAAIASILRAAGKKTGLFTSPHLLDFTERMKIDGQEIGTGKTVELAAEVKEAVERTKGFSKDISPTFFEFITAMALLWFRQEGVEWAVLETGMGGRLDSTNVVTPEVSVITTVGVDHKEFLGGTLREIAQEKAGIIKQGVPVVLGPQRPETLAVFEERFFSLNRDLTLLGSSSPRFFLYGREFSSALAESSAGGVIFDYSGSFFSAKNLFFPLAGDYQIINGAVAAEAAAAAGMGSEGFVREGLRLATLPGRLELLEESPEIRLDGAHNPDAAAALAGALRKIFLAEGRRLILVLGIMGDKDIDGILAPLLPLAAESGGKAIFTAPAYGRAAGPEELQRRADALGFYGMGNVAASSLSKAIREAKKLARPEDLIVVTGSFYTAGEAKEILKQEGGKLSRLRETR